MESFDLAKRSITHLEHVNRMVEMFVYIHTFFTGNFDCFVYYILEFPISRIAYRVIKDFRLSKYPSIIQNKVKSSSPCKQNPSIKSLF